jgi:hypothetical protein
MTFLSPQKRGKMIEKIIEQRTVAQGLIESCQQVKDIHNAGYKMSG